MFSLGMPSYANTEACLDFLLYTFLMYSAFLTSAGSAPATATEMAMVFQAVTGGQGVTPCPAGPPPELKLELGRQLSLDPV